MKAMTSDPHLIIFCAKSLAHKAKLKAWRCRTSYDSFHFPLVAGPRTNWHYGPEQDTPFVFLSFCCDILASVGFWVFIFRYITAGPHTQHSISIRLISGRFASHALYKTVTASRLGN